MADIKDKNVYVLPVPGRDAEIAKIRDRVVAAGGVLVCEDKPDLKDWKTCVAACDVVVVLICPESGTPEIAAILEEAARQGKEIIGVWLDEAQDPTVPEVLERIGDSVVVDTLEAITEAVIDGKSVWQDPTGQKRPNQKTPRHKGRK